jgi:hypothetical protein
MWSSRLDFKKIGLTFSFSFARAFHILFLGKKQEGRRPTGDFPRNPLVWPAAPKANAATTIPTFKDNAMPAWTGNARRVAATADWTEPPHLWFALISGKNGHYAPIRWSNH